MQDKNVHVQSYLIGRKPFLHWKDERDGWKYTIDEQILERFVVLISQSMISFIMSPNFEKVGRAYCFWSVRPSVQGSHFFVTTVTF